MLLIGNGILVTRDAKNTILQDGCVAIEGNLIAEVGTTAELKDKYKGVRYIDADKKLIMPGLINTHMHYYSTFA
jgi:cytosine/adenosine deaminase-related metal-dependent hydrolase